MTVEFVVVVVGVLVALAADSAMDRMRQRDERVAALQALRSDTAADLTQLDTLRLPMVESREEARRYLLAVASGERPFRDSVAIVQAIATLGSYNTFDANTSAIEYLKSTGQSPTSRAPRAALGHPHLLQLGGRRG